MADKPSKGHKTYMPHSLIGRISPIKQETMYKPTFNKRRVLVFHQFGNKGWSLFSCLGREVVCSVLSVSTLTYASAESVSTNPVTTDSVSVPTAREQMLDEVSVTGSRAPLTRSQAARMVTVLERADIQQAPVQSINDLLKYAVGIDVRQRSPIGSQTDVTIRGGTQEQVIILLNGINICNPQTAHNTIDLPCDLADIQRIEVIEGPAGRIYGSSSLVGAINIVTAPYPTALTASSTASPESPSPSSHGGEKIGLRLEGGSFGYGSLATSISLPPYREGWRGAFSASYSRSDGWSRNKSGGLNSDYSGAKAFYQGSYDSHDISVSWQAGLTDKGWGSSTSYASPKWQADDQYEHTTKLFAAVQAKTRGTVALHPTLFWTQHRDRYEGYRNQPDLLPYNYNRTNVYGLSVNSHFDWQLGRTALGGELRNEDLVSSNLGEPLAAPRHISGTDRDYTLGLNRTNISAFAEHNILLRNLTVSAGVVAVKNTWADMDWGLYPGIDASLRLGTHWRLHASYNTSLRMPSFTEMYYKLQGYKADPHLKPEEMRAIEVGFNGQWPLTKLQTSNFKFQTSNIKFQTSLWYHHGRNMIDWIMDTRQGNDAVWHSVNHTRLNSIGLETSAQCTVHNAQCTISYSYIDQQKDLEEGIVSQYALEYLRHKLVVGVQLPLLTFSSFTHHHSPATLHPAPVSLHHSSLTLGVNLRWQDRVGQYTDFDGIVNDYEPFTLVDARLTWQATAWQVYMKVNNLFGTTYRDYGLVPQPDRWLIVGTTLRM